MVATTADGGKGRGPARGSVPRPAAKLRPSVKRTKARRRSPGRAPDAAHEAPAGAETAAIALSTPEPAFAARLPAPAPERSRPAVRRAIFLDVENTSRPQHLAHVIEHLAVDRRDCQTELVAVANWKVVSHDSARLLAKMGAHLVHSAPSTGVRDWSDLRIAVAAGIWLAAARAGDTIEIVSDDRAFDAVGDVAASLGIEFHRLSYRRLVKEDVTEIAAPEPRREPEGRSPAPRRRRRGGRRRSGAHGPPSGEARPREPGAPAGPLHPARAPSAEPGAGRPRGHAAHAAAPHPAEPHTAPHDEIVSVVRDLVEASSGGRVSVDALANALKSRGFRRPPGSPRLMTRLRRIREIVVSPSGAITLAGEGPEVPRRELHAGEERVGEPVEAAAVTSPGDEVPAGRAPLPEPSRGRRRPRRRRRGGRRSPAPSAPAT